MSRFLYQPHHIEFLDSCCGEMPLEEVSSLFEFAFGRRLTKTAIKSIAKRNGISVEHKGSYSRPLKYSDEQIEWIKNAYRKMTPKQMCEPFNKRFGTNEKWNQLRAFIHNHGINSGRTGRFEKGQVSWNKGKKGWKAGGRSAETRFKKGQVPSNHKPVGSERISKDGYIEVKTAEPNVWNLKHRLVWIEHHGSEPEMLRFRDGNPLNCDISNLVEVSRSDHAIMNKLHIRELPEEVEPAVRNLVGVVRATKKAKERVNNAP